MQMAKRERGATIPVCCAHDELVTLERITGNPRNPNTHPKSQIELLAKIIAAQGWRAPITVSTRSGLVVRGHGRLEAARLLGLDSAPVDFQDYESEASEWADLVADNRIAELSEMDVSSLAALLSDLSLGELDMDLTGFDAHELERLFAATQRADIIEDEVPDLPAEAVTQPGDLWMLGQHQLLCGDSTLSEDVDRLMAGERAACMWTDPPYGVGYVGKTKDAKTIRNDGAAGLPALLDAALANAAGALAPGAPFYLAHPAGALALIFEQAIDRSPLTVHQGLVWLKSSMVLGHSDYHYRHEPIIYGFNAGPGRSGRGSHPNSRWFGDNCQTSVLSFDRPAVSEEHPTMKPVSLVAHCLGNSTPVGGLVLDPFAGSGTTLIAAERTHRRCFAVEIDPAYCDVVVSRFEALTGVAARRG
jgi:DNA modification methylase